MAAKYQIVKGMRDIVPPQSDCWHWLESILQRLTEQYGYQELRLPIAEKTELFTRGIGNETDIVGKEMYTFEDRDGTSLSLRPEGTAPCVRAVLDNNLLQSLPQRLWYRGPMFRRERPQKNRYRQFYQFGLEMIGSDSAEVAVEVIVFAARLWRALGLADEIKLEINSLGNQTVRAEHREALVAYFTEHAAELDEDSQRRLEHNPLRILDSKNPKLQDLIAAAPSILDFLDDASKAHFDKVQQLLDSLDIRYQVNPHLVRGLDYYTHTVFEFVANEFGAQATVCAGGRYDNLIEQFGGAATPAVGFALGIDRVVNLLQQHRSDQPWQRVPQVYFIHSGGDSEQQAWRLAEAWRENNSNLRLVMHVGGGNFKKQFKRADKSGASFAVILGEEELAQQQVAIKSLREDIPQQTLSWSDCQQWLEEIGYE